MDKIAAVQKEEDIAKQLGQLGDLQKQMAKMQTQLEQAALNKVKLDQVQGAFNQGILKAGEDGKIEVVLDPEESEMIRLSQYDDAQS